MRYRKPGGSGLKLSAVSIGGWINFGEGKVADDTAREVVEQAYQSGINFFDLADAYGRGAAERQMGAVLKQYPRQTLVISSKLFWPMSEDDPNDRGLSRKHIMESIDKSLKRLQTDYLDIYFCHRPDPETPIRETALAMHDLIQQGKVLYWGTSEWEAEQITAAHDICEKYGWHLPVVEQPHYSMLWREKVEKHILPAASSHGIGLVPFSPLAQGMLTGKYDAGIPGGSRFDREKWAHDRFVNPANVEKVKKLKTVADDLGLKRSQLALAWCLRLPGVTSVITGATNPAQVAENVKAAEVDLSADDVARIEAILAGN
jgi:voltage-dependent potassium channel beta subunit